MGEKARIAWRSRRGVREMAEFLHKHGVNAARLLRPGGEAAVEADRINALVELKQRMDDLLTGQAGSIRCCRLYGCASISVIRSIRC